MQIMQIMQFRQPTKGLCPAVMRGLLKIFATILLLAAIPDGDLAQQPAATPLAAPGNRHAGIEITCDGLRAIVLLAGFDEEKQRVSLLHSEFIPLALESDQPGKLSSTAVREAANAVLKLKTKFEREHQISPQRLHIIAANRLRNRPTDGQTSGQPDALSTAIKTLTGKTISYLEPDTETELSIVSTIPRREKIGETWYDARNTSLLIEINSDSVLGGYQQMSRSPGSTPSYEFVTLMIPHGPASLARAAGQDLDQSPSWTSFLRAAETLSAETIGEALRRERERKPGLVLRKQVYLSGGIVWALATLLYPDNRQRIVPLSTEDIFLFAQKAARDPRHLLSGDLFKIRDREIRREAERDVEAIKKSFSPQQLAAGAEILKRIAVELELKNKKLVFARFSDLSCLLSYVRLQMEN